MKFNINNEIKFFYSVLMRYASFFGSFIFWVFTVILLLILNQSNFAIRFAIASIIAMVIEYIIKGFYKIKRPDFSKVKAYSLFQRFQESRSFPSGHSANIALLTTMIHFEYSMIYLTVLFIVITLLVGLSRMTLKRHYLKDVIGGYALGILIGLFV